MDHLPPLNEPHNPIVVRFLGGKYTGHGFTDFKLPDGVHLTDLQAAEISSDTSKSLAPILQVWFYFGLLHEVLDLPICRDDFVTTLDGVEIVTTVELKDYLKKWKAVNDDAKKDVSGQTLLRRNKRVVDCLHSSFETWYSIPRFADIVGQDVQLSIHILASALENAVECTSDITVDRLPWRRQRSTFLAERMLQDRWCPAIIEQVAQRSSVPWHYYASMCPPSVTHGSEYDCKAGDPGCKMRSGQTSNAAFLPKHVCSSRSCQQIEAMPAGEVEALIEEGFIPLLEYNEIKNELYVRKLEDGMQYTALSHVWTDGLGNAERNGVPACQLERLQRAMSKLPWTNKAMVPTDEAERDKVWQTDLREVELSPDKDENDARCLLFWIDTICVPLQGPLRKKAINSMRLVYNRANRVLVFDADLVRVRGSLCAEEVLTRISLSNWVRRFWTLQEAILAKILWFQFGDDSYQQLSIATKLDPKAITEGADLLALVKDFYFDNEVAWYSDDFNFQWRTSCRNWSYARRLAMVWAQLQYRASQRVSDQPICIATLMDMDIDAIQDIDEDIRLSELWRFYEEVPAGVIFVVAPRIQYSPLRWAPAILHRLSALPPPGMSSSGTCTERGLEITHHGIITTSRLEKNKYGVIPMKVDGKTFLIKQNLKQENTPWDGIDFTTFKRLAVLLSQDSIEEGGSFPIFERCLGALVGIKHVPGVDDPSENGDNGVIECEYLRAVSVLLQGSLWEHRGQTWTPAHEAEKKDAVPAVFSRIRQQWLIS